MAISSSTLDKNANYQRPLLGLSLRAQSRPRNGLQRARIDAPGETPIPAVGAGLPLMLGAGGLVRYWRRRKAAVTYNPSA